MGWEILNDHCPAFPAIDGPVEPAVRRDNDSLLARGNPAHGGVRLRKRPPDALPARAAVLASKQEVAPRGPQPRGVFRIHAKSIDAGWGASPSACPSSRAV